jgi:hypothetical protein
VVNNQLYPRVLEANNQLYQKLLLVVNNLRPKKKKLKRMKKKQVTTSKQTHFRAKNKDISSVPKIVN